MVITEETASCEVFAIDKFLGAKIASECFQKISRVDTFGEAISEKCS